MKEDTRMHNSENQKPRIEKCNVGIERSVHHDNRPRDHKHEDNPQQELSNLFHRLKEEFDPNDIQSCQNVLLVIYNSIFLGEDDLTSREKYQIFALLDKAIESIEKELNNKNKCNKTSKTETNQVDYIQRIDRLFVLSASPHIIPNFKLFKRGATVE